MPPAAHSQDALWWAACVRRWGTLQCKRWLGADHRLSRTSYVALRRCTELLEPGAVLAVVDSWPRCLCVRATLADGLFELTPFALESATVAPTASPPIFVARLPAADAPPTLGRLIRFAGSVGTETTASDQLSDGGGSGAGSPADAAATAEPAPTRQRFLVERAPGTGAHPAMLEDLDRIDSNSDSQSFVVEPMEARRLLEVRGNHCTADEPLYYSPGLSFVPPASIRGIVNARLDDMPMLPDTDTLAGATYRGTLALLPKPDTDYFPFLPRRPPQGADDPMLVRVAGCGHQPLPYPGVFAGDYGPQYAGFSVELVRLEYVDRIETDGMDEIDEDDSEDDGRHAWMMLTKITGDPHVCPWPGPYV